MANRNLLQQIEFLRLQATSTPFPFPNSLPNSYFADHQANSSDPLRRSDKLNKKNNDNNKEKRKSLTNVWNSPVKDDKEKRNSSPSPAISHARTSPMATPTTPPKNTQAYLHHSYSYQNSNYANSNSPPKHHITRASSEPMIVGMDESHEGIIRASPPPPPSPLFFSNTFLLVLFLP